MRKYPAKVVKFDVANEIRAIARERVGRTPAGRVITPKPLKKARYSPDYASD